MIWISKEACEYVERAHSKLYSGFLKSPKKLPNGSAHVDLRDETLKSLERHMLPGEDYSDIIIRIAREAIKERNN
jgi:hypothetical protein